MTKIIRYTVSIIPLENIVGLDDAEDELIKMRQEIDWLSKELERLQVEEFGLQQFAGSNSDIWFYTGSWLQQTD